MAQSVNVWIDNWTNTGTTVPVPRWSVHLRFEWIDDEGNSHVHDDTHYFPNELAGIPTPVMREYMEQLIMAEVRRKLGVDPNP